MDKDDKPKGAEAVKAIEEGLSMVFGKLADIAREGGSKEVHKTFGGDGEGAGVFHARVRTSAADEVIRSRGGRSPTKPAEPMDVGREAPRDIHAEATVEDGILHFSCEVPGVTRNELDFAVTDTAIVLSTSGERRYRGSVALDGPISPEPRSVTLNNGILEAEFDLIGEDKDQ